MDGGCQGCNAKIIEQNAANEKTIEEAQRLANEDGQWRAIYYDEYGNAQIIRADSAAGYPVTRFVSPKL